MIFGIGTDIIEVGRIEKQLESNSGLKERLFTPGEIIYCESRKNKAQHYAARFAAKEAFLKAIGTGWRDGLQFNEIEVTNDHLGKPIIVLSGKTRAFVAETNIINIQVSLSHIRDMVNAIVIIEK
ncbi:MAG: holo-ACP synthase [Bacteroidales bacterium]|nr:holo-ACP synthase [Bacteroidales bacterium]MDZ4203869.1 holo-ACP synthase [Bacteroidales bacterium]